MLFPEPSIASVSEFPVQETSLHIPLTELPNMGPTLLKGPLLRERPISKAFLYVTFRAICKGALPPSSPCRAPLEREAPFPEPTFILLLKVPGKTSPPTGPLWRELPAFRALFYISLGFPSKQRVLIKSLLSLEVPGKAASPPWSPNRAPTGRDAPFPAAVCSFICISQEFPVKEIYKTGGNILSPSTEQHAHGRPTYKGVWPGPPRGLFMTLLLLPQCHAAFSTIPPPFAAVDQSPVSQRVKVNHYRCPLHTCYRLPRTKPHNPEVRTRGWIYGRLLHVGLCLLCSVPEIQRRMHSV